MSERTPAHRRPRRWRVRGAVVAFLVAVLAFAGYQWRFGGNDDASGPAVDDANSAPVVQLAAASDGQTAVAGTGFPQQLAVKVTAPDGSPKPGVSVLFQAPENEPTAVFAGGKAEASVTSNSQGVALSPPLVAGAVGGTYSVVASAPRAAPVAFRMQNNDPTIVAAGDIACPPDSAPTPSSCQQQATSDLALSLAPTAVLPLGDEQYENATSAEFASYDASWGRLNAIAYPVPGNHEYGYGESVISPSGGDGYFSYFGERSHPLQPNCTSRCTSWYSYDLGGWHLVALDSECQVVGGCNPGSAQYQWLLSDLNAHNNACTLLYWHIPLFSSSTDREPAMQAIYELATRKGVDVILNGHAHFYERFAPQDVHGNPGTGPAEFIVGTGGRSFFPMAQAPSPNSVFQAADTFGVLQMTLSAGSYSWAFMPVGADTPEDSGTARCD